MPREVQGVRTLVPAPFTFDILRNSGSLVVVLPLIRDGSNVLPWLSINSPFLRAEVFDGTTWSFSQPVRQVE